MENRFPRYSADTELANKKIITVNYYNTYIQKSNTREAGEVTTLPMAGFERSAPTPIVFPQIAGGGGDKAEFILLSAGGGAGSTLAYYDDEGSAMPVGRIP